MVGFLITLGITVAVNALAYAVTPRPSVVTRGPRISDLRVTSSAYGKPIPLLEGRYRLPMNIVWSTGIEEVETKKKVGGKGGGGQTDITYSYYASFSGGICAGVVDDVVRMWADGKLMYDKTGTTTSVLKDGLTFRFYGGTADQLPDSLIQADKGANTPGFRDLCHIVFDRMPLADFGNRIPNITVEVTADIDDMDDILAAGRRPTVIGTPMSEPPGVLQSVDSKVLAVDWERGHVYTVDSSGSTSETGIRRFNLSDMVETKQILSIDAFDDPVDAPGNNMAISSSGDVVLDLGGGNSTPLVRLDPVSLTETARFGVSSSSPNMEPTNFTQPRILITNYTENDSEKIDFLIMANFFGGGVGILRLPDLEYVYDSTTGGDSLGDTSSARGICSGFRGGNFCDVYVATGAGYGTPSSADMNIWRVRIHSYAAYDPDRPTSAFQGIETFLVKAMSPGDIIPGETSLREAGLQLMYDQVDNNLMFFAEADSDGQEYFIKIDSSNGDILWRSEVTAKPGTILLDRFNNMEINGKYVGFMAQGVGGFLVDTSTGEVLLDRAVFDAPTATANNSGSYDSDTNSWVGISSTGIISRWFFDRKVLDGISVGSIVRRLSARVGLTTDDVDTTDIDADVIPGYAVMTQTTARGAIEPLSSAYFFDGVESDFKMKFVKRGQGSVRTITQDDLGYIDEFRGEFFIESRIQEVELPEQFSIAYVDVDNDYMDGYQHAKRIKEPAGSMRSSNIIEFDFTAAIGVDLAKQIVEMGLYSAWQERDQYTYNTAWTHIDLDPTDRITLAMDGGDVFQPRIITADIGVNLLIEFSGVSEGDSSYSSDSIGYSGDGVPAQVVRSSYLTQLILMDSPLLRDSHEPASRAFSPTYFFMGGYGGSDWVGAALYGSPDNVSYSEIGRLATPMTWGSALSALGDPPQSNPFITDEINSMRVVMEYGGDDIAGVTQLEMLNRANGMAVIKLNGEVEIIQFRDVVQESDGSFTLSGFLRGRRGTDTMTTGHSVGERVILLESTAGALFSLTSGELDVLRYYRPVGSGQTLDGTDTDTLNSEGRALMPYAPRHVAAVASGSDVLIEWVRRTRIGGALQNNFGGVPLNEDTEEYEIEIIDDLGNIGHIAVGLTTTQYLFLAADIADALSDLEVNALTITNPGAEVGAGTGWTNVIGTLTRTTSAPSPRTGTYSHRSGAGTDGTINEAYQDLTFSAGLDAGVDTGRTTIDLQWWQGRLNSTASPGRMSIEFFDAGSSSLGVIDTASQSIHLAWELRSVSGLVPALTRTIRITMYGTVVSASISYAAFDDITCDLNVPSLALRIDYPVTIKNSGAEQGLDFWTGAGGVAVRGSSPDPDQGLLYFFGGPSTAASSAYQDIELPAALYTDIDAGDTRFDLAWAQNSDAGSDLGTIDLEFFNSSMVSQGTDLGVDAAPTDWTEYARSADIPTTTRTVRITQSFTRVAGTELNAYIDSIRASVRAPALTPTQLTVRVYQMSAQVGRGFTEETVIYVQ